MHEEDIMMAANVAAAFCLNSPSNSVPIATLPTLAYLADRTDAARHGHTLQRGPWIMTPAGPVSKQTKSLVDGETHHRHWNTMIERNGDVLRVRPGVGNEDLGELSRNAHRIIDEIWTSHGQMDAETLSAWCLDEANLPEVGAVGPGGDITMSAMLQGAGLDEEIARDMEKHDAEMNGITDMWRKVDARV